MGDAAWIRTSVGPVSLERPADWDQLDGADEIAVVLAGPERPSGFRSSLNVAIQRPGGTVHDAVKAGFEHVNALGADAYLLDFEEHEDRTRALFTFRAGPRDVTAEQWYRVAADTLVIVTAMAENVRYAEDSPTFERMVESVQGP